MRFRPVVGPDGEWFRPAAQEADSPRGSSLILTLIWLPLDAGEKSPRRYSLLPFSWATQQGLALTCGGLPQYRANTQETKRSQVASVRALH